MRFVVPSAYPAPGRVLACRGRRGGQGVCTAGVCWAEAPPRGEERVCGSTFVSSARPPRHARIRGWQDVQPCTTATPCATRPPQGAAGDTVCIEVASFQDAEAAGQGRPAARQGRQGEGGGQGEGEGMGHMLEHITGSRGHIQEHVTGARPGVPC